MTDEDEEPGHRLHPDTRYRDSSVHIESKGIDLLLDADLLKVADIVESVEAQSIIAEESFRSVFDGEIEDDVSVTVTIEKE